MILNQVTLTLPMNSDENLSHSSTESDLALEQLIMILDFCEIPRSRAEIQEKCGYKAATYFRNKVLKPLIEGGQLELTIPEKPNHPHQKYIHRK